MEEEKLVRGNRKDMCWIGTLFNMEKEKYRILHSLMSSNAT
jgi:hypothetical protein